MERYINWTGKEFRKVQNIHTDKHKMLCFREEVVVSAIDPDDPCWPTYYAAPWIEVTRSNTNLPIAFSSKRRLKTETNAFDGKNHRLKNVSLVSF